MAYCAGCFRIDATAIPLEMEGDANVRRLDGDLQEAKGKRRERKGGNEIVSTAPQEKLVVRDRAVWVTGAQTLKKCPVPPCCHLE